MFFLAGVLFIEIFWKHMSSAVLIFIGLVLLIFNWQIETFKSDEIQSGKEISKEEIKVLNSKLKI